MTCCYDGTHLFKIIPYPNPSHLPAGYSIWFWSVQLQPQALRKVAGGTVEYIKGGRFTTHASNVVPDLQRQGIYSKFVLPRLADHFGEINSSTYHSLSLGARGAWIKAGATLHYRGEFYKLTGRT